MPALSLLGLDFGLLVPLSVSFSLPLAQDARIPWNLVKYQ